MTTQVTSSRSSTGPSPAIPFSREPKARREALAKQLPLQEGRKVAFHPPAGKAADGSTADADETWILAVITKCINQDKNRWGSFFGGCSSKPYYLLGMKCKTLNLKKTDSPDSKYSFSIIIIRNRPLDIKHHPQML